MIGSAVGVLVALAGIAVVAATAVSFGPYWRLVLFSQFRPHLIAASLLLALLGAIAELPHNWNLPVVAALLAAAAVNLFEVVPAVPRRSGAVPGDAPRLRIAFVNILRINREHSRLIDWVRANKPDLLVVCEAEHSWPAALTELNADFYFATTEPVGDIVIYSRWPLGEVRGMVQGFANGATTEIGGLPGPLTLVALHNAVPSRRHQIRNHHAFLETIGTRVAALEGGVIVLGDFNATPWSRPMRRFVRRTGLAYGRGARRGSFPAGWPTWLALPIDLILARGGWRVIEQRPLRPIGSDHRPMLADVAWVKEDAEKANRATP